MNLTFIGTKGYIEESSRLHRRHTALLITHRKKKIMIDCGEDWLGHLGEIDPHAIILTHAHPDHAWGLKQGAECPVYAAPETWDLIKGYPIAQRKAIEHRKPFLVFGVSFEAFPVDHSIRCPALGYRISVGKSSVFYVPDVLYIHDRKEAMQGIDAYIGDGATITRSFVRRHGDALFGHAPVRTQLTWCTKEGVKRAIITHCGKEITAGDPEQIKSAIAALAREKNLEVSIAWDGMKLQV